jgi:hypothetical protein
LHSKVEFDSLALKEKLALVAVVTAVGPAEIVVSGAVVSAGGGEVGVGEVGAGIGSGSGHGFLWLRRLWVLTRLALEIAPLRASEPVALAGLPALPRKL